MKKPPQMKIVLHHDLEQNLKMSPYIYVK